MSAPPPAQDRRTRADLGLRAVARAFFYLQATSLVNSLRQRLRRMRQPKYLFGALAGGAYLYVFVFRRVIQSSVTGASGAVHGFDPAAVSHYAQFAAVPLCLIVLGSWLFPSGRAALHFSEADVAFLFPAPVTRTTLIHYALLRSQLGIFFSSFLMSLLLRRGNGLGGNPLQHAAGMWLILSMISLHFLGASFVRERLLDVGMRPWLRRTLVAGLFGLVVVLCAWSLGRKFSLPAQGQFADVREFEAWAAAVVGTAPLSWLLAPFRWVVAPFFATDLAGFLRALGPALALLAAHYLWVVRSQVSFEEASIDLARRRAERIAAMRQGNRRLRAAPTRARRPPFRLAGTGFVPTAFLWKGLIAMGPLWRLRTWLIASAIVVVGSRSLAANPEAKTVLMLVGITTAASGSWILILGPMMMQRGMREMLQNLDILRAGPLRGWQIALGELLCPIVVMTFSMWFMLVVVASTLYDTRFDAWLGAANFGAAATAITLVAPPLCGLMLCVPFAGLLWFPAWTATPGSGGRGIEVMGQRLIFMGGYLVTLAIALVPATAVGGLAFYLLRDGSGPSLAIVVAALLASAMLGFEFACGVDLLGRRIDRFDVSQELR